MCATSYSGPECMCSTGTLGSDGRSCSGNNFLQHNPMLTIV